MKDIYNRYKIIIVLIFLIAVYFNSFDFIDIKLKDYFYQQGRKASNEIVIIGIDDESLKENGRWPWSRIKMADILEVIEKGEPAVVEFDIVFSEESNEKEDEYFNKVLKKYDNVYLAEYAKLEDSTTKGKIISQNWICPIDKFKKVSNLGNINIIPDYDGIVRKIPLVIENSQKKSISMPYLLYKDYMKNKELNYISVDKNNFNIFIDYKIDFKVLSFNSVLNRKIFLDEDISEKLYFKDKIVIIAPFTTGIDDYYYTSLQKNKQIFGAEIQANIIDNLLNNNLKKEINRGIMVLIVLVFIIISLVIIEKMSPICTFLMYIVLNIIYIIFSIYMYELGIIINIIYPIIWTIICYSLFYIIKYLKQLKKVKEVTNIFGEYVSPKIVKELINKGIDNIHLGGISKYVTLFFVDIRGFTTISEKLQPNEVVDILNKYFSTCVECIFKYDGTLDKFVGDEIMALFNAPVDVENHELMAVKAAVMMRDKGEVLKSEVREKYNIDLSFGIGINAGEAIIGNIGTKFRMDYTAIGDAVNTAARLQGISKGFQIIISDNIYQKVKSYIDVVDLDYVQVKGKKEKIKIWEVKSIK